MLDFIPPWLQGLAVAVGSIIGGIVITRKAANKRIDDGVSRAKREIAESHKSLVESQERELHQLRKEVQEVRAELQQYIRMNDRLETLRRDLELRLAEKDREIRIRDTTIVELENRLALAKAV